MHEFGLCSPIVDAALLRARDRPVAAIRVRVGIRHRVVDGSLQAAFAHLTEGTVLDGATLEVVAIPAEVRCAPCGAAPTTTTDPLCTTCPVCGGEDIRVHGGEELTLESLRYRGP